MTIGMYVAYNSVSISNSLDRLLCARRRERERGQVLRGSVCSNHYYLFSFSLTRLYLVWVHLWTFTYSLSLYDIHTESRVTGVSWRWLVVTLALHTNWLERERECREIVKHVWVREGRKRFIRRRVEDDLRHISLGNIWHSICSCLCQKERERERVQCARFAQICIITREKRCEYEREREKCAGERTSINNSLVSG